MSNLLDMPEEPVNIKEFIRSIRVGMGEGGSIDYDSLAVWTFNRFPKFLWEKWSSELKSAGYTWQKFLRVLRLHTGDIVMWALTGELEWKELIGRIVATLERYGGLID